MKRLRGFTLPTCMALALVASLGLATAWADTETDLALQQERQKQIQADTDSMVRRLGTMLRVLEYYQIDKTGERQMLEEMAGALSGLSKNQMAEVVRRLEAAAKTKDDGAANQDVQEAYDRHREILDTLKGLLARYDALRNLDQAAERLERVARNQLELYLQTAQLIKDSVDQGNNLNFQPQRFGGFKGGGGRRNVNIEPQRQADAQNEIQLDVSSVLKQVLDLRVKLPEEQKERARRLQKIADQLRVVEHLTFAAATLKTHEVPARDAEVWALVNEKQWQLAGQIKELARVLRGTPDLLTTLHEAGERVDQAIARQDEVNKETKENEAREPNAEPKQPVLERFAQEAAAKSKIRELTRDQARLQYDTKDTANLVKPYVEELAKKIDNAEQAMKDSRDALAANQPKDAARPQDKATKALQEARADLDKLIAEAEKRQNDPLAALKKAAENLEKLIKDQTETRDKTKDTMADQQVQKLPELARNQKDLANRTADLKDTPLPNKESAKKSLDQAQKAMTEAAKALKTQQTDKAVPKQEQALKALEDVKKEFAEKIAELEKRKEDMAQLEDAAKKLAELAKAENNIADKAKEMSAKAEPAQAKDLAKSQDKLTPQAKDVAKKLEAAAPEASKKVNEGTQNMESAKKELDKNQAKPASAEAKEAAKKLEDAQKDIAKALDQMKAKDIADQAAMKNNKLDPDAAARQIAKALEQTQKAADRAKQAEMLAQLDKKLQKEMVDLAKLQENIAKQADQMSLPDPAKDASKAAQNLKQSAIVKALQNQEKALGKLEDASQKPLPKNFRLPDDLKARPAFEPGNSKGSATKDGTPQAAEAKRNDIQPGENKDAAEAGQVKAGAAKLGIAQAAGWRAATKPNQAQPAETKLAQENADHPNVEQTGVAKSGAPPIGETKAAPPQTGPAKTGDKPGLAKADQPRTKPGNVYNAGKPGPPKDAPARTGLAKGGEAMQGEAKSAQAHSGEAKSGPGARAQVKAGDLDGDNGQPDDAQAKAAQSSPLPQAKNPTELAKLQKEVMDATKALLQSQDATEEAMAALGQAQAQAPKAVQKQLQRASMQLAKANQNLQKGKPGQAGQKQDQAAKELANALKAMNGALAGMKKQPGDAQAKANQPGEAGEEGMGDEGMGQDPMGKGKGKQGQPKTPGQAKAKKQGPGQERKDQGDGNRIADGRTDNPASRLTDVNGDGSFLHLPPRQRELIRQALSGQLPPEYSAMIQQYYMNLARGRALSGAPPAMPDNK